MTYNVFGGTLNLAEFNLDRVCTLFKRYLMLVIVFNVTMIVADLSAR